MANRSCRNRPSHKNPDPALPIRSHNRDHLDTDTKVKAADEKERTIPHMPVTSFGVRMKRQYRPISS